MHRVASPWTPAVCCCACDTERCKNGRSRSFYDPTPVQAVCLARTGPASCCSAWGADCVLWAQPELLQTGKVSKSADVYRCPPPAEWFSAS